MNQKAAASAFDFEGFLTGFTEALSRASGRTVDPATLRAGFQSRTGEIYRANEDFASDDTSRANLLLVSALLAIYRESEPYLNGPQQTIDLIEDAMRDSFLPDLHDYMSRRFDVQPDRPEEAFVNVSLNFIARGRTGFGAGFTYEQDVLTDEQCFVDIVRCFFFDFFTRNDAPELTRALCAMDMVWADELNSGPYNVAFERPTTMSGGNDRCRFQFTRQGKPPGTHTAEGDTAGRC
jgi:hypothetical protein